MVPLLHCNHRVKKSVRRCGGMESAAHGQSATQMSDNRDDPGPLCRVMVRSRRCSGFYNNIITVVPIPTLSRRRPTCIELHYGAMRGHLFQAPRSRFLPGGAEAAAGLSFHLPHHARFQSQGFLFYEQRQLFNLSQCARCNGRSALLVGPQRDVCHRTGCQV